MTRSRTYTLLALAVLALATWQATRRVCPTCHVQEVKLASSSGAAVRARLYVPAGSSAPLPAVVVLHGYLANLAFVEVPWVEDLAALGCAVLLVDRRGHGRSGGAWWPEAASAGPLATDADVAAGLAYLRGHPRIDPARLALLGHSDGGGAAVLAGSSEWDLRATVALSASMAPWMLVNHVTPRNLLLAYGAEDRFVLDATDRRLIGAATRGHLSGPGVVGALADGSARRLLVVPEHGHVDVLFSPALRTDVLAWLGQALETEGRPSLAPTRHVWIAAGAAALGALLATGGAPATIPSGVAAVVVRLLALAVAWVVVLMSAAWLRDRLPIGPGQEGATVLALLTAPTALLGGIALLRTLGAHRDWARFWRGIAWRRRLHEAMAGAALGALVVAILMELLRHLYDAPLAAGRWGMFGLYLPLALLAFGVLAVWLRWVGGGALGGAAALATLAAVTAVLAPALLARMAVLPAYLLAATLGLTACRSLGSAGQPTVAVPVMAAVIFARLGAGVTALY